MIVAKMIVFRGTYLKYPTNQIILSSARRWLSLSGIKEKEGQNHTSKTTNNKVNESKDKNSRNFTKFKIKTRAEMINVNHTDWSSVYETASPYNMYVVPLEIRMGRPDQLKAAGKLGQVSLSAQGNIELLKIPNFFHLTPPAIKKHCMALMPYCTPWPSDFDVTHQYPLRVSTINYLYSGPSIRHPESKKVKLQVYLKDLCLDKHAQRKFKLLVGDRYNPNNDELTLIADKCPTRKQNKEYAYYLLTALYVESKKVQPWENEANSISEDEIDKEIDGIRAELNPAHHKETLVNRRYYKVINEKLIRYNSYGHPFVCEMRKYGIKGGLTKEEISIAKNEWQNIQKGLPDLTTFDPPYQSRYASENSLH